VTSVVKPPEQVEKVRPDAGEKGAAEKKVARTPAASQGAKPEMERADDAVKRGLVTSQSETDAMTEAKIGRQPESGASGESRIAGKVNGTEIEDYNPSPAGKRAIQKRVEQNWANRKLKDVAPEELTNQEREGLGVESAREYLKDTGQYKDLESMGGRNKADLLALDEQDKLCVVECKGHTAGAKDAGYLNEHGEKVGNLASETQDGVFFENEPAWLERNRPHMDKALQDKMDDPSTLPAEKAKCQRLQRALEKTDFYDQNSYRRLTVTAGPQAEYGNIGGYVQEVKPNKMVQIRVPPGA
jgi:hypothetical protein